MPLDLMPQTFKYAPSELRFWVDHQFRTFSSPLTRTEHRQRLLGIWKANFVWDLLKYDEGMDLKGFFDLVHGGNFAFNCYDPSREDTRGVATESMNGHVASASQTGKQLVTHWPPGLTDLFKAGDLIMMNTTKEVYEVTKAVDSGAGTGAFVSVTLDIAPYIRQSPAADEVIRLGTNVLFTMRLDSAVVSKVSAPWFISIEAEMSEAPGAL